MVYLTLSTGSEEDFSTNVPISYRLLDLDESQNQTETSRFLLLRIFGSREQKDHQLFLQEYPLLPYFRDAGIVFE
jgi:hypothetical protein